MTCFIIVITFGLINAFSIIELSSQDRAFSQYKRYKRYIEEKTLYENLRTIRINDLSKQELTEYFKKWDSIAHINYTVAKQLNIAQAWYLLDEYDKAIDHYNIAFEKGFDIEHLRAENVMEIYDTLKTIFSIAREHYFSTIDTNLRTALYQMQRRDQSYRCREGFRENETYRNRQHEIDTINIEKLIQITNEYGWPGRQLIGWHPERTNGRRLPPTPSLIVIHNSEFYYYYFLEKIIASCAANQESWNTAESIMQHLLIRFERIDYHNKLRYIFIDNEGRVDFDRSLLLLNSLFAFLDSNPSFGFNLYLTNLHPTQDVTVLYTIKDFLTKRGIQENRIGISEEIIDAIPNELGNYYFATKSIFL